MWLTGFSTTIKTREYCGLQTSLSGLSPPEVLAFGSNGTMLSPQSSAIATLVFLCDRTSSVVSLWCSRATSEAVRVLVVEDEPGIAQFVRQGLSEAGYAVDVARDGREGLDYALSAEYDLLILDILLPMMDGLRLLRELRNQGIKAPVLLLTARDRTLPPLAVNCYNRGTRYGFRTMAGSEGAGWIWTPHPHAGNFPSWGDLSHIYWLGIVGATDNWLDYDGFVSQSS